MKEKTIEFKITFFIKASDVMSFDSTTSALRAATPPSRKHQIDKNWWSQSLVRAFVRMGTDLAAFCIFNEGRLFARHRAPLEGQVELRLYLRAWLSSSIL